METIVNCYNHPIRKLNSIYIGYDCREQEATEVLQYSIEKYATKPLNVVTLNQHNLRRIGLYRRAPHMKSTCWGTESDMIDCFDGRPLSTEFSFTRFLTPMLNQMEGYALFMDCDMYFRSDPNQLFEYVKNESEKEGDDKYAVWCVKHNYNKGGIGRDTGQKKMYGCPQMAYPKKNWSSFILWNCSHPANRRLTVDDVNTKSGSWLHRFSWLEEEEIGSIPEEWNFLDGHSDESIEAKNVHFTTGGPWFPNWRATRSKDIEYVKEWESLKKEMNLLSEQN